MEDLIAIVIKIVVCVALWAIWWNRFINGNKDMHVKGFHSCPPAPDGEWRELK